MEAQDLEEVYLKSKMYTDTFDKYLEENGSSREILEQQATEEDISYEQLLRNMCKSDSNWIYIEYFVSLAGGEGKEKEELETLLMELMNYEGTYDQFVENQLQVSNEEELFALLKNIGFRTEEDFIKYMIAMTYAENTTISVEVSNGESFEVSLRTSYYEYHVGENGEYIFKATGEEGETGEVAINVDNIAEGINTGEAVQVNEPVLKSGMQAIKFESDGTEIEVTDTTQNDWYSYEAQTHKTINYNKETQEYGTSHWANAKLNGNYYVWIPRYAYKINKDVKYVNNESGTSYGIDVIFIGTDNKRLDGTEIEGLITDYSEVTDTVNAETNYIVHPAFTFGTDNETEEAKQLSGIWVGKYETSGTETAPTILPNQQSKAEINVSAMFTMAQNVLTTDEQKSVIATHMMKNIEWGAVAYLTQSQYGRNGTEISMNQCENFITGAGKAEGSSIIYEQSGYSTDPTLEQQYNGKIGKASSTTGNVYGIYDMSGGRWEYVMGFYGIAEDTPELSSSGFSTVPDRKYYDLYINKTSSDSSNIGDALFETSGWNDDSDTFITSYTSIFMRGAEARNSGSSAGLFSSFNSTGNGSASGFRVCLAVE